MLGKPSGVNALIFLLLLIIGLITLSFSPGRAEDIKAYNFRISKIVANENTFSARDPSLNDHGRIAFVGEDRSEYSDIYLYDGDKITNITSDLKVHAQAPVINNTDQIAFLDVDWGLHRSDIYLYDGQGIKNITADLDIFATVPSLNDHGQIAFVDRDYWSTHIYFYDGSEVKNLTPNSNISVIDPYRISINNKGQIAFWGLDWSSGRQDIYIIDGTKLTNITSQLIDMRPPVVPISYVDLNDYGQLTFSLPNLTSGREEVYLYDGGTLKNITANTNFSPMYPQINNQGQVTFVGHNGQYYHVYLYDKEAVVNITANLYRGISGTASSMSLNNKGQVAFEYPQFGSDIYFYDGQEITNITYNELKYCPCSYPDLNDSGQLAFFGTDSIDRTTLYFSDGNDLTNIISDTIIHRYTASLLNLSLNNQRQVAFSTPAVYVRAPYPNDIYFYDGNTFKHITANMELGVSPPSLNNNGWIAFAGSTIPEEYSQKISNIYLYDGNTLANLTADLKAWATSPSLNDWGQIAFTVSINDLSRSDIYFYDGENFTNITAHLPISSSNPILNNNGQVAFEGLDPASGRRNIYLYDKGQITNITAELDFSTSLPVLNDYGQIAFKHLRDGMGGGESLNRDRTTPDRYRILPADSIYFYNGRKIAKVIQLEKINIYNFSLNNQSQIAFSDGYNIYLAQPNKLPIAEAGTNQIVAAGAKVKLDGSGSSDPEGDPLSYRWLLVAKPVGSNAYLSDPAKTSPSLVTDLAGIYEVQLIVRDRIDESVPDKVIITAVGTEQNPIAYAGPDQVVSTGSTVILDGTNSYNPNKDELSYNWSITLKPLDSKTSLANTGGKECTLTVDTDGIYKVQLIVNNNQSVSEPDTMTIIALGRASTIRVATNKSHYSLGDTIELYL